MQATNKFSSGSKIKIFSARTRKKIALAEKKEKI
jgi:hypothetical protein